MRILIYTGFLFRVYKKINIIIKKSEIEESLLVLLNFTIMCILCESQINLFFQESFKQNPA